MFRVNYVRFVRYEVFTAVAMRNGSFWDIKSLFVPHRKHYVSATEPSRLMLCKIWGFHGGDYEECLLLGYKSPVRTSQETHYVSATEHSRLMLCKTLQFYSGDYEDCRLLGCDAIWFMLEPTFRRNMLFPLCMPLCFMLTSVDNIHATVCFELIFVYVIHPTVFWINMCSYYTCRPPLWPNSLVVGALDYWSRGSGFDSWCYQIFWEVVGLERGPLSLVRIIEEQFGRNISGCDLETRE
jgi:hypothetical protein